MDLVLILKVKMTVRRERCSIVSFLIKKTYMWWRQQSEGRWAPHHRGHKGWQSSQLLVVTLTDPPLIDRHWISPAETNQKHVFLLFFSLHDKTVHVNVKLSFRLMWSSHTLRDVIKFLIPEVFDSPPGHPQVLHCPVLSTEAYIVLHLVLHPSWLEVCCKRKPSPGGWQGSPGALGMGNPKLGRFQTTVFRPTMNNRPWVFILRSEYEYSPDTTFEIYTCVCIKAHVSL